MSAKSPDLIERQALWETHGKRCAYCGKPLLMRDMEIDHLIPQSLSYPEIQSAIVKYHLPSDFSVLSWINMLPSCRLCNGRKSDLHLQLGYVAVEIARNINLQAQFHQRAEQLRKRYRVEQERLDLLVELSKSGFDENDVRSAIDAHKIEAGSVSLSYDLDVLEGDVLREILRSEVEIIKDTPIKDNLKIRMVRDEADGEIKVSDIMSYEDAVKNGYYTLTTYDRSMEARNFSLLLGILNAVNQAKPSTESFIDTPYVGVCDIKYLSAELLFTTADMTSDDNFSYMKEHLLGKNVQDMVDDKTCRIDRVGHNMIGIITYERHYTFIKEIIRADLNDDGNKDILVYWGCRVLDGTYGYGTTMILSRNGYDAILGRSSGSN